MALATLGLGLLALAVPRTAAAWMSINAQPAMEKLRIDQTSTKAELLACIHASEAAIAWVSSAVRLGNLGSCELALAQASEVDKAESAGWLAKAERHTEQSLLANPADGFAWTRLAFIRQLRGAGARDVVAALLMSLDTAPNGQPLWSGARTDLLLFYAPYMEVEELFRLRYQLRTIWEYASTRRVDLVKTARRRGRLDVLKWALGDNRQALSDIDRINATLDPH